tara:strand:- start:302 stop:514 length:213 start_codon:yes stop_codon:yes gene_type:complete
MPHVRTHEAHTRQPWETQEKEKVKYLYGLAATTAIILALPLAACAIIVAAAKATYTGEPDYSAWGDIEFE